MVQPVDVNAVVGPEVATLHDLARQWKAAGRSRALVLRVPTPPKLHRALADGALTAPSGERRGTVTFEAWLNGRDDAGDA